MKFARLVTLFAVPVLALANSALAAERGPYAPENIEATNKGFYWVCMVKPLCPVSDKVRELVHRVVLQDRSAEYLLGLTLLVGDDLTRDRDIGVIWIVRAAERGEPGAARDIARRLRNGESIEVDETKIADSLKPQVDAGDVEAMRALAPMIMAGRGTRQEPAAGLAMLQRAADWGSSKAEKDLAQLYLNGAPGVAADRPQALKWLATSARHGDVDAMVDLGHMSVNAAIDARNLAKGYCWLVRAAMLDHVQAQEKLSMLFALGEKDDRGTVIAVDLAQADLWFRLAARSPYHNNSQIRAMIEPKMTTAQLDDVKRQIAAWRAHTFQELAAIPIALPATSPARNCPAL
jgi:TPR repeat protein